MLSAQAQAPRFRGPLFDHYFVWGIPLIGLAAAGLVLAGWAPFLLMLTLDLFLLGYHHVISTYTRFSFDAASAAQNRFLLLQLPLLVVASVLGLVWAFGPWIITTIYLHWQWFHYTRQSEGVGKAFGFKTGSAQAGNARLNRALFYLTPLTCLLALSHRQPAEFLYMSLYTVPVPLALVQASAAVTGALFALWLAVQARAVAAGTLRPLHLCYFLGHHAIYVVAYVAIADINLGWLAINTWHNLQYISFVWVCNVNQHKLGYNRQRPLMSWLSQPQRAPIYIGLCVIAALAVYAAIDHVLTASVAAGLLSVATIIVYQSINFHHYIVDSVIWKLRKPAVRSAVGIAG